MIVDLLVEAALSRRTLLAVLGSTAVSLLRLAILGLLIVLRLLSILGLLAILRLLGVLLVATVSLLRRLLVVLAIALALVHRLTGAFSCSAALGVQHRRAGSQLTLLDAQRFRRGRAVLGGQAGELPRNIDRSATGLFRIEACALRQEADRLS